MSVLSRPTLVLNNSWVPISVSPIKRALKSVCNGRAGFLCHDTYVVHNFDTWKELEVSEEDTSIIHDGKPLRMPEIIVLNYYNKFPARKVKLTRRNLLIRDDFKCQYTGKRIYLRPPKGKEGLEATIDHIIPQSKKGKTTWDNVVMCSLQANSKKGNRSPKEAGFKLLNIPKEPKWSPLYSRVTKVAMSHKYPESWAKFLKIDPDLYWDIELQSR